MHGWVTKYVYGVYKHYLHCIINFVYFQLYSYLPSHYIEVTFSVHFNHFYHTDLQQTKEGLSYVNLHISRCG